MMQLTDAAKGEIEALKEIFADEATFVQTKDTLELHYVVSSEVNKEKGQEDIQDEEPFIKLVLIINDQYPDVSPDIRFEESCLIDDQEANLLATLNEIKRGYLGEEVLFCLINQCKDTIDKYYEDAQASSLCSKVDFVSKENKDSAIVVHTNAERFEKWKAGFINEALDELNLNIKSGCSMYEAYWKLPQCYRSMLYIYAKVPPTVLLPTNVEGKEVLTGRQIMLQRKLGLSGTLVDNNIDDVDFFDETQQNEQNENSDDEIHSSLHVEGISLDNYKCSESSYSNSINDHNTEEIELCVDS